MFVIHFLLSCYFTFFCYPATCVIDNSEGTTFNNRSYPLKLQNGEWYVVMQHTPKQSSDSMRNKAAERGSVSVFVQPRSSHQKVQSVRLCNSGICRYIK